MIFECILLLSSVIDFFVMFVVNILLFALIVVFFFADRWGVLGRVSRAGPADQGLVTCLVSAAPHSAGKRAK